MRVLVFTTLFPNHQKPNHGIFVRNRVMHLAKLENVNIHVVAPVPYSPAWIPSAGWRAFSRIASHEVVDGVCVEHPRYFLIPKIGMVLHGILLYLSTRGIIDRLHQSKPFDLIDGHYIFPDGLAAVLHGRRLRMPIVMSARGTDISYFPKFRFIAPQIRYALTRSNRIVSVCESLKSEMLRLGIDHRKITVVPNGIDPALFFPIDRIEARRALSLSAEGKILVTVAALMRHKGVPLLLDALSKLVGTVKGVHLYVIGEGAHRPAIQRQIDRLRLGPFVTLAGEKQNRELHLWYNSADIFCLTSEREGWANAIMESLACGTPVVATRVNGTSEIMTAQHLGRLVECNSESVQEGIREALKQTWDRNSISAHVRDRTWMKVALEVNSVLGGALKKRVVEAGKPSLALEDS